jgi:putative ABC transport system substrate-binding protein
VIVANGPQALAALRRLTSTIPIVFVQVGDPVDAGFVASLAHPGGNITGFVSYEKTIAGKLLELLKEIAPDVSRVSVIITPDNATNALAAQVIDGIVASTGMPPRSSGRLMRSPATPMAALLLSGIRSPILTAN